MALTDTSEVKPIGSISLVPPWFLDFLKETAHDAGVYAFLLVLGVVGLLAIFRD